MKHITPQRQLFGCLSTDEQKRNMALSLRHLKKDSQEDLCLALVAFIRFGMIRHFSDPWLQRQFEAMRCYLYAEQVTYHPINQNN